MLKVIKLSTGEELLGEYNSDDLTTLLKDPCIIQMVPSRSDPSKAMLGLFPYASYVKGSTLEIANDHIVWMGEPVDELYNQYNSIFGSGIQLATNSLK